MVIEIGAADAVVVVAPALPAVVAVEDDAELPQAEINSAAPRTPPTTGALRANLEPEILFIFISLIPILETSV